MYIGTQAAKYPHKAAVIHAGTGEVRTYAELDARSNRIARLLRDRGVGHRDPVAFFMENNLAIFDVMWAALRSGLLLVPINRFATDDDVEYIVDDCGAKAIFTSAARAEVAVKLNGRMPGCASRFVAGASIDGWEDLDSSIASQSDAPMADERMGGNIFYTSGTTGRPKGVVRPLPDLKASDVWPGWRETGELYGLSADTVYLSPAPLYHSAPLRLARPVHMAGGTVVMMEKFDPLEALRLIEAYRVTHSQWVPTMFGRMLALTQAERDRHDLSSHRVALHAAAPCPVDVKRRMIDWWGPILDEYYGASDGAGLTRIASDEWLTHPGSVGRTPPSSTLHICNDDGSECAPGEPGLIYFVAKEGNLPAFLNDPEKTRAARHPKHAHWVTPGDVGYVDEEGYLYLTDRKAFMIISGGVNIYPQIIEDALLTHPAVADAAVFGVPNADMGEEVKAVVETRDGRLPSDALARELIAYCGARLARYMIPRSVDFVERMPRTEVGKLMKKELRDGYWAGGSDRRIALAARIPA